MLDYFIQILLRQSHFLVLIYGLYVSQENSLISILHSYEIIPIQQRLKQMLDIFLAHIINLIGSFAYVLKDLPMSF